MAVAELLAELELAVRLVLVLVHVLQEVRSQGRREWMRKIGVDHNIAPILYTCLILVSFPILSYCPSSLSADYSKLVKYHLYPCSRGLPHASKARSQITYLTV